MSQNQTLRPQVGQGQVAALGLGLLSLLACVVGAYFDLGRFLQSYLFAFMFWLGLSLGSFAISQLHQLTGGNWGFAIRRILESAANVLPLMALLFVPIALDALGVFGPSHLYAWAHPEALENPMLRAKSGYLEPTFFVARAAIYFALWIGLAWLLNRLSSEQDRTGSPAVSDRMRLLARFGIVAYILSLIRFLNAQAACAQRGQ